MEVSEADTEVKDGGEKVKERSEGRGKKIVRGTEGEIKLVSMSETHKGTDCK